jgi:hypothetical protein
MQSKCENVFSCTVFPLTIISVLSSKRRANAPIFTDTKAVKRGAGMSMGASSCPPSVQEPPQQGAKVAVPAPGARVELDTDAAEVAPVCPASLAEAICNTLKLGVDFFFFSLTKFRRYPFLFPFRLAKP